MISAERVRGIVRPKDRRGYGTAACEGQLGVLWVDIDLNVENL